MRPAIVELSPGKCAVGFVDGNIFVACKEDMTPEDAVKMLADIVTGVLGNNDLRMMGHKTYDLRTIDVKKE